MNNKCRNLWSPLKTETQGHRHIQNRHCPFHFHQQQGLERMFCVSQCSYTRSTNHTVLDVHTLQDQLWFNGLNSRLLNLSNHASLSSIFVSFAVGPYIGRYCGQNTPGRIISYTGILALTINTDSAIAKEGFSANFTVLERTVPDGKSILQCLKCIK